MSLAATICALDTTAMTFVENSLQSTLLFLLQFCSTLLQFVSWLWEMVYIFIFKYTILDASV